MSRKLLPLQVEHLAALGGHPESCLCWQQGPGRTDADDPAAAKREWLRSVLAEHGSCGRVVVVDGVPVGVAFAAPARWFPGTAGFPTAPVSRDALVLAGLYVDPAHRGRGLARMLVQAVARDVVSAHDGSPPALETFADTRGGRGCLAGVEVYDRLGFRLQRAHPTTPRMRMDLRTSVSWRDGLADALDRLAGAVRGRREVSPAGRTAR